MKELDKAAMGQRIRQIRLGAGLRQWELARILGTTQSAVHKYEHGVVPEPKRLVELARAGRTSVEWILTGTHWENGSRAQERIGADVLAAAAALKEIGADRRHELEQALDILRRALDALGVDNEGAARDRDGIEATLRSHGADAFRVLQSAWRIQCAVLAGVVEQTALRWERDADDDSLNR